MPKQNTWFGVVFMLVAVLGLSMKHIFAKMWYVHNPKITNVDILLFFGIWIAIFYIPAAKYNGLSFNIMDYRLKVIMVLFWSVILSLLVNFWMLWGISMISVAKSTLIFNLNPILTVILAFFLLREKIDKYTVISVIMAFAGVILMSINKASNGQEEILIPGIILNFTGAVLEAWIFVSLRMLNIYLIHPWLRPAFVGMLFPTFWVMYYLLMPDYVVFPHYDLEDLLLLSWGGVGNALWVGGMAYALKYQSASKIAPLNYLENVLTLLADLFLFNYEFGVTDYLGKILNTLIIIV